MSTPAKIAIPKLSRVYTRHRLFSLFDVHLQQPAMWLSGPPGAGKTTVVTSYIADRALYPLWYRCDEGDADPATLFHYLSMAAGNTGSNAITLPGFTPEYLRGVPVFARRFFRELFANLPEKFVLVFDNYQDVGAAPLIQEIVRHAIEELPDHGHIIFISRAGPPVELSRACVNGALAVIPPDAIRLDEKEAAGLLESRSPGTLTLEQKEAVVRQTQGWAAGMILLSALGNSGACKLGGDLNSADLQSVFDYFAVEIFRNLEEETQKVLLCAALLPTATAGTAAQLSNIPHAGTVLEYLTQNSYFTLRDGPSNPSYQFHPLFRAFLLKQLETRYALHALAHLRKRAIGVLIGASRHEDAVSICQAGKDWDSLSLVLQEIGPVLVRQGRYVTLTAWLSQVDEAALDLHPWLRYWRGVAALPYSQAASQMQFALAYASFATQADAAGMHRSWAGMVEALRTDPNGDNLRLDPWLEAFDSMIERFPDFESPEIECDVAFAMFTALNRRSPADPRLTRWRDRAIQLSLGGGDVHETAIVLSSSIIHDLLRGDHARAALYIASFRSMEAAVADPRVHNTLSFTLGYYLTRIGEFDSALEHVEAGLHVMATSGATVWQYQLLGHGVTAAISKGNHGLAQRYLDRMAVFAQADSGFAPLYYHVLAAWQALATGNTLLAREHAQTSVEITSRTHLIYFDGIAFYGLAQVLFQTGERRRAEECIAQATAIAHQIDSGILKHMCGMVAADFAYEEGRMEEGQRLLSEAMRLGRDERYINFTFWMPAMMSRLCAHAMASDIEPEYARHIIRARKLPAPDADIDEWPWPVKILTLDHFVVLVDGNSLTFTRKAPKKLISLLKAIIAFGGRDVAESRLADALWPDQEADVSRDALEKALQRLRKMIGEDALVVKNCRVSLNPKLVWIDVWSFERLVTRHDDRNPQILAKAILLYRQNFLADEDDAPWSISLREKMRTLFIRSVSSLARDLVQHGHHHDAIDHYQNALGIDSLAEELYQGALMCYVATGRYAEGLALYRRLRQTLSITLGITPSAATEKLHQALLAHQSSASTPQQR